MNFFIFARQDEFDAEIKVILSTNWEISVDDFYRQSISILSICVITLYLTLS